MSLSNIFSIICLVNFFLLEYVFSLTKILSPFVMMFFALFFLILPIIILLSGISSIGRTLKSKEWPHVRGRISDVEAVRDLFSFFRGQRYVIVYDYYVKDKLHSNDQFNPSKVFVQKKDLFHIRQLRTKSIDNIEGTFIGVYFNPENPWEAIICNKTYLEFGSLLLPSVNALIITLYIFL